jgi:hypothetical protein
VLRPDLLGKCGSCARFARVVETIADTGEVTRTGECLLSVWPGPLSEESSCPQWVERGKLALQPRKPATETPFRKIVLPEELLDMDVDEFKSALRQVIREELAVSSVEIGARWKGGQVVLKPGKEGTQEKAIPLESFFHKIVMIRDRLRVLEQRINSHSQLADDEKVQMQQYITQCYGSLTTFNILFAEKDDAFSGQKE